MTPRHAATAAAQSLLSPVMLGPVLLSFGIGYSLPLTPVPLPGAWLLGAGALAAWCVNAVAWGDLSIYGYNQSLLRDDPNRAVVSPLLTRPLLNIILIGTGVLALALVAIFGWLAWLAMVAFLAFNYFYAMPPAALARRPAVTVWVLPLGVVLGAVIGSLSAGVLPGLGLLIVTAIVYLLVMARVCAAENLQSGVPLAALCSILAAAGGTTWLYARSPVRAAVFGALALVALIALARLRSAAGPAVARLWLRAFRRFTDGLIAILLLDSLFIGHLVSSPYQHVAVGALVVAVLIWSTFPESRRAIVAS